MKTGMSLSKSPKDAREKPLLNTIEKPIDIFIMKKSDESINDSAKRLPPRVTSKLGRFKKPSL